MFRLADCLLAAALLNAGVAQAATTVYQASFDQANHGWTIVHGAALADASIHHGTGKSLRVEPGGQAPDAMIRSAPVSLAIGKRYELSGWVRTDSLEVRDLDRSPIAAGATLSMASMPFDVHSTSLGGTSAWTRLSLRFVASRAEDHILLSIANGGRFRGKAWFDGVSLDEVGSADEWPAREAVKTFGPAYRYPAAGWIYLHIEGKPYQRGYQHGYLMAREIPEYLERCAADLGANNAQAWANLRTTANAFFLRGFDREILEEMRGIADGASAAGIKWQDRPIDLVDIVVANVTVELSELRSAMSTTPTGLEGLKFESPAYYDKKRDVGILDRCSAFAATGPATKDGKMIVGHVTWWPLTLAEQTNVWLDIKPESGHRMLMQSYPGGIESGTDWYQNDAGLVLTETTIRQTPFNPQGTPVAYRARIAIQYAGSITEMVERLGTKNNGLYTNEWIMGDARDNEIAMYELGTSHTRLWRSSRNQWFGNTPGFYWGNNNAKDLTIRTEYLPDPQGQPEYVPYVPAVRDLAWQDLYQKYRGQIDEQFAFLAFRTAPLVSASTMDAKVVTADMANRLMVWSAMGKPNQREWVAGAHNSYDKNDGLYPSGYYLFSAQPSQTLSTAVQENEKARLAAAKLPADSSPAPRRVSYHDRLWKGWIVPASEADTWFAAGSAAYLQVLESAGDEKAIEKAIASRQILYRGLKLSPGNAINRFHIEEAKGVLFLDSLRRKIGDDAFLKLMADYFAANTTMTVTAQSFLDKARVAFEFKEPDGGPAYTVGDIGRRLASAVLVYGTMREAGANRYAAEQLQGRYLDQYESQVPIYKDFEVSDDLLQHRDIVFVGRPESNSALAAWSAQIGLDYRAAAFKIEGALHAGEREALTFAASNPLDPSHMVLVLAGNDALRTVKLAKSGGAREPYEYVVTSDAKPTASAGSPGRRVR